MSDFLTRRGSMWHFVRRVPTPLAALDPRGIVRLSTHVRIAEDRSGRYAARVAKKLNDELEAFWHSLGHDGTGASAESARTDDQAGRQRAARLHPA